MLVIRFSRTGKRGERKFRIVVKEKRSRRDGRAIATLGYYEKKARGVNKKIDMPRLEEWVKKGAWLSPSVKAIL